jgi:hypothetical protein
MKQEDDIPQKLRSLKSSTGGFRVPDGYFEQLSDEVWQKIQAETLPRNAAPAHSSWQDRLRQWLSAAFLPKPGLALVSMLVLLIATWFWFNRQESVGDQLAQVDKASVKHYVLSNIDEFEVESILDLAEETQNPAGLLIDLPKVEIQQYLDDAVNELDQELLEDAF